MAVVAVVTSSPPSIEGGHLVVARSLVHALNSAGHEAELLVTPDHGFGHLVATYAETLKVDVSRIGGRPTDQVISLRFPSYAVRHPRHVCWLNHTMREYYDLWDRFSQGLPPRTRLKEQVRRRLIHTADRYLLSRNVSRLFVQSETIRRRYAAWPDVRATVLYPPPPQRAYRVDDYEPYLFSVSRFAPLKRMDLLVEALAQP